MAVEPKVYRILTRLKNALVDNGTGRYTDKNISLGYYIPNPNAPLKSDQYHIWSEGFVPSDTFETTDQEEKFQVYKLKVFIYSLVSHKVSSVDKILQAENIIGYLHDDFVSLNMRDLATENSDESWIVGKRFLSATPVGAMGKTVTDVLVHLEIEFENRGSLFTTS